MQTPFKVRSESESIKTSRSGQNTTDRSLPRGEYFYANVIGPKLHKSPMQPQPVSHRPVDHEESFDKTPGAGPVIEWRERCMSDASVDSLLSSEEENPPNMQKTHSSFFKENQNADPLKRVLAHSESSSQFQKPPEKFYTPVIAKKKMDLYKMSIIQNASKFSETPNQDQSAAPESKPEEAKQSEISRIRNALTESLKEQKEQVGDLTRSKTENGSNIKQILLESDSVSDLNSTKVESSTSIFSPKNLVFAPNVEEKLLQKHLNLMFRGLNYSLKLLKGPPMSYIESRQITLKELKKKNTKTLLLDLDETLITSCSKRDGPDRVLIPEGERAHPIMIKIRPYVREFLKRMKEHYEILVFTASCSLYAETVVKELDPEKKFISYILDRNFCLETKNGFFIKDLRIIKNRELKNMIIVDNLVHSFGFQVENGVPILEWTGNRSDQELKFLADYLVAATKHDDLREYNKEKLRLHEFAQAKFETVEDI